MSTQPTIVEIKEEVTTIQASTEDIVVNLNPEVVEVEVNNFAIPVNYLDAENVFLVPHGTVTAGNVQDAIRQLADQDFRSATTPTGSNIEEGDTWYNIDTDQFYVYRRINPTQLAWVPIMVGNDSPDSDTLDAGAF
jgi:hypothetical protein